MKDRSICGCELQKYKSLMSGDKYASSLAETLVGWRPALRTIAWIGRPFYREIEREPSVLGLLSVPPVSILRTANWIAAELTGVE